MLQIAVLAIILLFAIDTVLKTARQWGFGVGFHLFWFFCVGYFFFFFFLSHLLLDGSLILRILALIQQNPARLHNMS